MTHKEEKAIYNKSYREKMKKQLLDHYGNACVCCGEAESKFLTIDHVEGGGTQQRKELKGGDGFYRWLIKNNFPEGFRTLCYNCNCGRKLGVCPHETSWSPSSSFESVMLGLREIKESREYEGLWK